MLQTAFQPASLHIEDESWKHAGHAGVQEHGGGHFVIRIKAECFNGIARTSSHRMIFKALESLFPNTIHALSIKIEP
ncbi:MAG: BolA family protein [Mariprofundus sp.]|nr:BolA family protein [Mariprofundus sp.]